MSNVPRLYRSEKMARAIMANNSRRAAEELERRQARWDLNQRNGGMFGIVGPRPRGEAR